MKTKIKLLIIIIFMTLAIVLFSRNVEAKSYNIENMDMQVTINDDGSAQIKHSLKYNFNGNYNGIYIDIPYNLEDSEYESVAGQNKINDELYNGDEVIVEKVVESTNGKDIQHQLVKSAVNGDKAKYTVANTNGMYRIKVYSPSNNEKKTFDLYYTIKNLCVKHNDVGELYYNFIGGKWECDINKLNIDIYLPNNQDELKIWGHGPLNRRM